jgi:hypothetical protein
VKKYVVRLTDEEQETLKKITKTGKRSAQVITRASILLKADQSERGPAQTDEQISEALEVTVQTVERVRKQMVKEGFTSVLTRRPYVRKNPQKKIDGTVQAHLIALSCSEPPEGYARWTLRLLSERLVELHYVDSISHESVRTTLKKNHHKAMAKEDVAYSPQGKCRVCVRHGRYSLGLRPPV